MISNTMNSFLAILLLCSQAITASGRVGGGLDCLSSEVLADQLWNCDEAVAGYEGHHEVEFVAKKASTGAFAIPVHAPGCALEHPRPDDCCLCRLETLLISRPLLSARFYAFRVLCRAWEDRS